MKYLQFLTLAALAAAVCGRPQAGASILRQSNVLDDNGYEYGYETDNGIKVQASGVVDPETGVLTVYGVYEYPDPVSGQLLRVQYIADQNGFQPQGAHLVRSAGVRY